MTEPTLQQIFDVVNAVSLKLSLIKSQVQDLKSDRDDHESRLRSVEQRTNETKRIDAMEARITQHDAAFTKQGERIGINEQAITSLTNQVDKQAPQRVSALGVLSVVVAASAVIVAIMFQIAAQ